jgi:hypothetical protein
LKSASGSEKNAKRRCGVIERLNGVRGAGVCGIGSASTCGAWRLQPAADERQLVEPDHVRDRAERLVALPQAARGAEQRARDPRGREHHAADAAREHLHRRRHRLGLPRLVRRLGPGIGRAVEQHAHHLVPDAPSIVQWWIFEYIATRPFARPSIT